MRGGVNGSSRLLVLMVLVLLMLVLMLVLPLFLFGLAYGLMVVRLLDALVESWQLDATDVDVDVDVDVIPIPVPVRD